MLYASTSVAQENILKGVVKDAVTGDVFTGGAVAIQGATFSTQTDADESFTIAAQPGQILVFSFVGYERKSPRIFAGEYASHTTRPNGRQKYLGSGVIGSRFPNRIGVNWESGNDGFVCALFVHGG